MSNSFADKAATGYVFNIQRYSVHDGEGIRTNVFLKGCPLRCRWCSNPESQDLKPELARNELRCLGVEKCDFCARVCPNQALALPETGMPLILRDKCKRCMSCAEVCPPKALNPYGISRSVEFVIEAVEQDSIFYSRSGGGMTLTGGEPFMQAEFTLALLREAKRRRLHCAAETCGQVPWQVYEEACSLLDELFYDIKLMDPKKHRESTGAENTLILENARKIIENFPDLNLCIRTPIIPGLNDSKEEVEAVLDFLEPYPRTRYEILAYHRLGSQKYAFLDRENPMGEAALDGNRLEELLNLVAARRNAC